tara:strand:- start:1405 stop:1722 length:318 start_codon:yes stop_codon:yes gene_type:complete
MGNKIKVILTTFPKKNDAIKIGEKLVELNLSPCVQLIPQIESIYKWKGKTQKDNEVLLLIKYRIKNQIKIIEFIKKHHTYEIPEIITSDFEIKNEKYKQWFFIEN